MAGFFPKGDAKLSVALTNFGNQIASVGTSLNLSPADVKTMQTLCSNVVHAINTEDQKKKEWQAAARAVNEARQTDLVALRKMIAHLKTHPAWTGTIGKSLGVASSTPLSPTTPTALESYKPPLRIAKQAGRVELRFTRGKLDGVNVYMRKKGEAAWRLLDRVRYSPYADVTPTSTPGVPEVREYRVFALYKDKEVGQPSDIVSTTVGE